MRAARRSLPTSIPLLCFIASLGVATVAFVGLAPRPASWAQTDGEIISAPLFSNPNEVQVLNLVVQNASLRDLLVQKFLGARCIGFGFQLDYIAQPNSKFFRGNFIFETPQANEVEVVTFTYEQTTLSNPAPAVPPDKLTFQSTLVQDPADFTAVEIPTQHDFEYFLHVLDQAPWIFLEKLNGKHRWSEIKVEQVPIPGFGAQVFTLRFNGPENQFSVAAIRTAAGQFGPLRTL